MLVVDGIPVEPRAMRPARKCTHKRVVYIEIPNPDGRPSSDGHVYTYIGLNKLCKGCGQITRVS